MLYTKTYLEITNFSILIICLSLSNSLMNKLLLFARKFDFNLRIIHEQMKLIYYLLKATKDGKSWRYMSLCVEGTWHMKDAQLAFIFPNIKDIL